MKQFLRASMQSTSNRTWKRHGIKLLLMLFSLVAMPVRGKLITFFIVFLISCNQAMGYDVVELGTKHC